MQPLLNACAPREIIDLDTVDSDILEADLRAFVHDALSASAVWEGAEAVIDEVATKVAATLTGSRQEAGWGQFLVAVLYVDFVRDFVTPSNKGEVYTALKGIPSTLPDVLELDLQRDPDDRRRTLLTVFALAKGEGMPLAFATSIADALSPGIDWNTEARSTLNSVLFYLRIAPDSDGTTLYRPFHQAIADHLLAAPEVNLAGRVVEAVISSRETPNGTRQWANSPPYVARHFLTHAAEAQRAVEFLSDPEVLVVSDPEAVHAALRATQGEPRAIAAIYRASPLAGTTPDQRRDILSLNAARIGDEHLAYALSTHPDSGSSWTPRWSTGSTANGAVLSILTSRPGGVVFAVDSTIVGGRLVAVTGGDDRAVRMWDLTTGTAIPTPVMKHDGSVRAVACATLNGRPVAITGSSDLTVRMWDLTTGTPIPTPVMKHDRSVRAVACTTLNGRPVAITGSSDLTVRMWDLTTGDPIPTPVMKHDRSVRAVACTTLNGRPVAITGGDDRAVRMWDLTTGDPIPTPVMKHDRSVRAVACTTLNGRPVAITGRGRAVPCECGTSPPATRSPPPS